MDSREIKERVISSCCEAIEDSLDTIKFFREQLEMNGGNTYALDRGISWIESALERNKDLLQ